MAIESMVIGDAGVTALAMVGVGRWSMGGKYFSDACENRLTHKAVKTKVTENVMRKENEYSFTFTSRFYQYATNLHEIIYSEPALVMSAFSVSFTMIS